MALLQEASLTTPAPLWLHYPHFSPGPEPCLLGLILVICGVNSSHCWPLAPPLLDATLQHPKLGRKAKRIPNPASLQLQIGEPSTAQRLARACRPEEPALCSIIFPVAPASPSQTGGLWLEELLEPPHPWLSLFCAWVAEEGLPLLVLALCYEEGVSGETI